MRHLVIALLLAALSTCVMPPLAPAAPFKCTAAQHEAGECEPYAEPDVQEWYDKLRMPDAPDSSCCGDGDAYFADEVDRCTPGDQQPCALVAIVTDTRTDRLEVRKPDGSVKIVNREHIAPGTRVAIPPRKLRRPAVPNPTEHDVVFVGVAVDENGAAPYYIVHCYEPIPRI